MIAENSFGNEMSERLFSGKLCLVVVLAFNVCKLCVFKHSSVGAALQMFQILFRWHRLQCFKNNTVYYLNTTAGPIIACFLLKHLPTSLHIYQLLDEYCGILTACCSQGEMACQFSFNATQR